MTQDAEKDRPNPDDREQFENQILREAKASPEQVNLELRNIFSPESVDNNRNEIQKVKPVGAAL